MTAYQGQTITYDAIGNPLSYYNGSSYTFEWENGRQLSEATVAGNHFAFEYNDEGIRTKKIINGAEHKYYLSGTQILAQEWSINASTILYVFLYDAEGSPIGMQYRDSSMDEGSFYTYWYEKNLQGDVVAIYNSSGVKVLSYSYDAWGNVTQTVHDTSGYNGHAMFNPFRYRGYYYDTTLNLYYLNSRYYDPVTGRFINADGQLNGDLLGYHLYSYCFISAAILCCFSCTLF